MECDFCMDALEQRVRSFLKQSYSLPSNVWGSPTAAYCAATLLGDLVRFHGSITRMSASDPVPAYITTL